MNFEVKPSILLVRKGLQMLEGAVSLRGQAFCDRARWQSNCALRFTGYRLGETSGLISGAVAWRFGPIGWAAEPCATPRKNPLGAPAELPDRFDTAQGLIRRRLRHFR